MKLGAIAGSSFASFKSDEPSGTVDSIFSGDGYSGMWFMEYLLFSGFFGYGGSISWSGVPIRCASLLIVDARACIMPRIVRAQR